jgi:hypothetical protein
VEFGRQAERHVSGAHVRRLLRFFSSKRNNCELTPVRLTTRRRIDRRRRRQTGARIFMLGFNRWHLSIVLAAILGGAAIVWLALEVLIPAPPKKITIATGQRNQIYQAIGNSYCNMT